jgi:hypothetical protein
VKKRILLVAALIIILSGSGLFVYKNYYKWPWFMNINPGGGRFQKESNKLEQYDFDSLKKRGGIASVIKEEGETTDVNIRRLNAKKQLYLKNSKKKPSRF